MSAIRGIFPCEGDGLSSAAPLPLRKRKARVSLGRPGTLRLPCDQPEEPWRFFIDDMVTGAGVPLPPTVDNEVRYLVDAPAYFAELASVIAQAGDPSTRNTAASDFVYIAGWYLGLDFPLVPSIPPLPVGAETGFGPEAAPKVSGRDSTMWNLLTGAVRRGAEVRIMLWANIYKEGWNEDQVTRINKVKSSKEGDSFNIFAIHDSRLLAGGAHHQKLVIIRRKQEVTAYCGGIDVAEDRLTRIEQKDSGQWFSSSAKDGGPYHDVQCRVRGPAAGYLLRTFAERWNDHMSHDVPLGVEDDWRHTEARRHYLQTLAFHEQKLKSAEEVEEARRELEQASADFAARNAANIPPPIPPLCVECHPPPPPRPLAKDAFANRQIVQIGRTYGDPLHHGFWSPFGEQRKVGPQAPGPVLDVTKGSIEDFRTYDFAPHGEQTIKQLLLRAIANAKRFIYVEDQYLIDLDIARAVAAVLPRLAHFTAMTTSDDYLETSFRLDVAMQLDIPGVDLPFAFWANHAISLRNQFMKILEPAGEKARVFHHRDINEEHTYVHSKTWIIDDEFVLIGSANCNQRSLTHDPEVCAAIADQPKPDCCGLALARRLRMALWAEHFGIDSSSGHAELIDGVASASLWRDDRLLPTHRITRRQLGQDASQSTMDTVALVPWVVPGLGWVGRSVISGLAGLKEFVVEQALVSLVFDPNGTCPGGNVEHAPMELFKCDMDRLKQARLEGRVYVYNKWLDSNLLIDMYPRFVAAVRYFNPVGKEGWVCQDFANQLYLDVESAAKRRFGPGARVEKWYFWKSSFYMPDWNLEWARNRLGNLSVKEVNHATLKLTLPDGTVKAVDFWDHWRYDLLEAPPIVRDWLPYETSWRNLLNGWLVPNDFAQGPEMPE